LAATIKWGAMLVCGFAVGFWYGAIEENLNAWQSILFLAVSIFAISYIFSMLYVVYVVSFSKNMKEVEKYLRKLKKNPYYGSVLHIINGEFNDAENTLPKIKNKGLRAVCEVFLHLENNNINEAIKANEGIKDQEIRSFNRAVIAMLQKDWLTFEENQRKLKNKGYQFALNADAAFRKGNYEQSKYYGDLAIKNTAGLQRYMFIKQLERQENNPNRESYF
jgi:hypothetical protein